jgi:hypothetical protein
MLLLLSASVIAFICPLYYWGVRREKSKKEVENSRLSDSFNRLYKD